MVINILMYLFFLLSFSLIIILNIYFIPLFKRIRVRQAVRTLGPKMHYKKNGTPTMGGVLIILSVILSYSYYYVLNHNFDYKILMLLFPFVFYGIIGFIDDYFKVVKQNNDGISPKVKFFLQLIFSIIFVVLFKNYLSTELNIFSLKINLGYFYYLVVILIFISTTNAVNISDGLDGLVSGEVLIVLVSVLFICSIEYISYFIIVLIGAILGFLCFNYHPAKIFMGDVGSLSIGASIATIFIILKIEVLLLVFCFMMVFEILSVIIQVLYFKITKGKRLFKMSPFHHHLELSGVNEICVAIILWSATLAFCLLGLLLYNYLY